MTEHTFLAGLSNVHRNGIVLEVSHRLLLGYDTAIFWMTCRIRVVRYGQS